MWAWLLTDHRYHLAQKLGPSAKVEGITLSSEQVKRCVSTSLRLMMALGCDDHRSIEGLLTDRDVRYQPSTCVQGDGAGGGAGRGQR